MGRMESWGQWNRELDVGPGPPVFASRVCGPLRRMRRGVIQHQATAVAMAGMVKSHHIVR